MLELRAKRQRDFQRLVCRGDSEIRARVLPQKNVVSFCGFRVTQKAETTPKLSNVFLEILGFLPNVSKITAMFVMGTTDGVPFYPLGSPFVPRIREVQCIEIHGSWDVKKLSNSAELILQRNKAICHEYDFRRFHPRGDLFEWVTVKTDEIIDTLTCGASG